MTKQWKEIIEIIVLAIIVSWISILFFRLLQIEDKIEKNFEHISSIEETIESWNLYE